VPDDAPFDGLLTVAGLILGGAASTHLIASDRLFEPHDRVGSRLKGRYKQQGKVRVDGGRRRPEPVRAANQAAVQEG